MTPRRTAAAVPAVIASLAAGLAISVQTSLNGHLNVELGSPVLAAWVNHTSALAVSVVVAVAMGSFPRAVRSLRAHRDGVRWWWFLGGILGVVGVLGIIVAAPELGVVVVAVAITLGQLAGSIIADTGGLGPAGKKPLTLLRLAGVAVAGVAVVVGAAGRIEVGNVWVLVAVAVAGVIIAIQQAWNGWIVVVTGEFAVMSVINFGVSLVCSSILIVATAGMFPVDFGAIPPWGVIGGVVGAVIGVVSAIAIRIVGVLVVVLCFAAGQAFGGILMDLLLPVDGVGLSAGSIVGALLAVVAVGLAGIGGMSRRRRRASAEPDEQLEDVAGAVIPGDVP